MLALWSGCGEAPLVVEFDAQATVPVLLEPSFDIEPDNQTHYRWELIETPIGSVALRPTQDTPAATFTPDVRGYYLIERWVTVGLSEDLSHRIVIHTSGVPPVAIAALPGGVIRVGDAVTVDASNSRSPEHLELQYQWRLLSRPARSVALLTATTGRTVGFVPDVPGGYQVELEVFDGELWSQQPHAITVNVFAP